MDMILKKTFFSALLITTIAAFLFSGALSVRGQDQQFPTYGSGAIEVRIYTDYFCPPCRGMEPAVEPVIRNLLKKKVIQLILVDTPFSRNTLLYAKYFLYALREKNNLELAFKVRNILFNAAVKKNIATKEEIEELFKIKGIRYTAFEPKPAFERFNALIKEDNINATPTCVIIKGGKKEEFIGGDDIIKALKALK
jgi:thiol:disulfide interchange protein DsbA